MNIKIKEWPCGAEEASPPSHDCPAILGQVAGEWEGAGLVTLTALPPRLGNNEVIEAVVLGAKGKKATADDPSWPLPPSAHRPSTPPAACLPATAGGEKALTWGMIRSSLMYMSCSTPADLREKGRSVCTDEEAASQ